jgi:hypothetical protein
MALKTTVQSSGFFFQRFGELYCVDLQGTIKGRKADFLETLVPVYPRSPRCKMWCYIVLPLSSESCTKNSIITHVISLVIHY